MRRRLVEQGKFTLMASLPIDWIRKHNLAKGDEVDVEERENNLIVAPTKLRTKKLEKEITVSKISKMTYRLLGTPFRAGYDILKINFKNPSLLEKVGEDIKYYNIGFEIIEQEKDYCIAKEIATGIDLDIDSTFKRAFGTLLRSVEESVDYLDRPSDDNLKNLIFRDASITRFRNFTVRMINKHGYKTLKDQNSFYFIVESMEKIGDEYKEIYRTIIDKKIKTSNQLKDIYLSIYQFLKLSYELIYNFDDKNLLIFENAKEKIDNDILKLLEKANKKELQILLNLNTIKTLIDNMSSSIIILNL